MPLRPGVAWATGWRPTGWRPRHERAAGGGPARRAALAGGLALPAATVVTTVAASVGMVKVAMTGHLAAGTAGAVAAYLALIRRTR